MLRLRLSPTAIPSLTFCDMVSPEEELQLVLTVIETL
jgi:hypothetical protein